MMSSIIPNAVPYLLDIDTTNGRVQISRSEHSDGIGLLVDRGGQGQGTILTADQAKDIAALLCLNADVLGASAKTSLPAS